MFNFFKKSKTGSEITFNISGMHCSSCALVIDNSLEDAVGVIESCTNYAKGEVLVRIDERADTTSLRKIIESLGYTVLQ